MKKTLLIAAVAMMATPAMASKARLKALNSSAHLEDIQQVFENPAKLTKHGDWLTFEFGATPSQNQTTPDTTIPQTPYTADTTPDAEGGFARGMGDARYGFYLGHHTSWVSEVRQPNAFVTQTTDLTDENPLNLFYAAKAGDLAWGVGLNYSNSDKKSTKRKQTATGLTAGAAANNWEAALDLGLVNTYKDDTTGATVDFKGKNAIGLRGKFMMDTLTFTALAGMNGGKSELTTTANNTDIELSHYNVGVVNSHKAEGADFFYGANYDMLTFKNKGSSADQKYTASQLPVFAGIEADATSWMVLRGSVTQNFILGTVKNEFNTPGTTTDDDDDTISNNTVVAAGLGLKFNKLLLDGTFSKASGGTATGAINGNDFMANAALTYMF